MIRFTDTLDTHSYAPKVPNFMIEAAPSGECFQLLDTHQTTIIVNNKKQLGYANRIICQLTDDIESSVFQAAAEIGWRWKSDEPVQLFVPAICSIYVLQQMQIESSMRV